MAKSNNVPEIRFAGFTDPWEQRKLGEVATFDKGVGFSKNDFAEEGKQLFHYGRLYTNYECVIRSVNTYANPRENAVFSTGDEVVTPSSGETAEDIAIASAILSPGIMLGGGLNIVRSCPCLDPVFLALSISNGCQHHDLVKRAQGKSVVHLYNDDLAKSTLLMPVQIEEQQALGQLFESLDNLITLHQRKYDKLVAFKKAMLKKMFPKEGETVPEIRFAGFTDPWEQRKLGDFAGKRVEKNTGGVITETFTNSAERGVVSQLDFFDHEVTNTENVENYTIVEKNDFVYNPRISAAAPVGPINRCRLARTGVMSPLYMVFQIDETVDQLYLEHYFKTDVWHPFMHLEGNSGARSDRFSISDKTFFEMPVMCPSVEEQRQIASAMENLNDLITLHQRKLEVLNNLKKAILNKMFV